MTYGEKDLDTKEEENVVRFQQKELKDAITGMKRGKSPLPDYIPPEVIKEVSRT